MWEKNLGTVISKRMSLISKMFYKRAYILWSKLLMNNDLTPNISVWISKDVIF